ncbi:hypothetical protein [Acetobacter oeni]|uniref:Conjugal transfer protein TrbC n=1 Tax=Acetobacter oeni TaxID=304077 RepID=A0A511XPF9_9PROT|nr:hypothetical protein [Acetobacter oeni]MBB3884589.1 hypothetical protein [Acetobacter oeni]NHO20556.1 hypothetical protein [Acetobacter oeni]GBR06523.1 hypothetical protein AA21952_2044 [Acetobacter oeni LMG 21952]GEN64827.1 hypothetical protein AOE01nite_30510 [Acetobacter oeni]
MNLSHVNKMVPARVSRPALARNGYGPRALAALGALSAPLLLAGHAFAQTATGSTNGIGAQVQATAQEGLTAGGFVAAAAMYIAAFICFIAGVWAAWQSRNEQNRSPGKVGMAIAGIVLCGLFATGPQWINKAANTASGGAATVGTEAKAYTFTSGSGG